MLRIDHDVVTEEIGPDGKPRTVIDTIWSEWRPSLSPSREDVAFFARYCMGSCYGDWSPQAKAIYDEVMKNDETFEFYRKQYR